jgi:hypothetical protein
MRLLISHKVEFSDTVKSAQFTIPAVRKLANHYRSITTGVLFIAAGK